MPCFSHGWIPSASEKQKKTGNDLTELDSFEFEFLLNETKPEEECKQMAPQVALLVQSRLVWFPNQLAQWGPCLVEATSRGGN